VKGGGHDGQDAQLSGKREDKDFRYSQGKSGKIFNDPGEEKNNGESGGECQLESHMKKAERVNQKEEEGTYGDGVDQVHIRPNHFTQEKG